MTFKLTDVRCSQCGAKVLDEVEFDSGGRVVTVCRKCKREGRNPRVVIEHRAPAPARATTE